MFIFGSTLNNIQSQALIPNQQGTFWEVCRTDLSLFILVSTFRSELVLTTSAASYSSELNETGSQALRTLQLTRKAWNGVLRIEPGLSSKHTEVSEDKPAWRFELITIKVLVTSAVRATMRRKKGPDRGNQSKTYKAPPNHPFQSRLPLHHHPWQCSMVQAFLDLHNW